MKKHLIAFLAFVLVTAVVGCKDDSEDPEPQPQEKYSVDYKLTMTGEYDDLQVTYYETGSQVKVINSITSPWEKSYDNFVAGDSVVFKLYFKTKPNKEVSYDFTVDINQGTNFINSGGESNSMTSGDTALPIQRSWYYKIPE